jgi:hypothetical protein
MLIESGTTAPRAEFCLGKGTMKEKTLILANIDSLALGQERVESLDSVVVTGWKALEKLGRKKRT